MKKFLSMLLAFTFLLSVLPLAVLADDAVLYKKGDQGDDVLALKERLRELQYYDEDSKLSNSYTSDMVKKVKELQKVNGLKQTGEVSQALNDLINSNEVLNAHGLVWNEINNYAYSNHYALNGDEQFVVSSQGNVIVLILDYFANAYLEQMLKKYPDALDMFQDFTYYSNCDPTYIGTYPSMCHMITGYEYKNDVSIGQWFHDAWTSDSANAFFDQMNHNGYEFHFYSDVVKNPGIKSEAVGKIQNLIYWPEFTGNYVPSMHDTNFYDYLKTNGLTTTDRSKMVIYQHLSGMHFPYTTNEKGETVDKSKTNQDKCAYGWLTIAKAYIDELKRVGAYDNSTIIITADHGDKKTNMQVIYMIKEANETKDKIAKTNAPISHKEFQSTVLYNMGVPKEQLSAPTIYDFTQNQKRERTIMCNFYNKKYAKLPIYNGTGLGSHNVWNCYTYTGNNSDLVKRIKKGPSDIVKMFQSYN